jgi:hypothetical protein
MLFWEINVFFFLFIGCFNSRRGLFVFFVLVFVCFDWKCCFWSENKSFQVVLIVSIVDLLAWCYVVLFKFRNAFQYVCVCFLILEFAKRKCFVICCL